MINRNQCTIGWHVNDLKISHVDSEVVDDILNKLDESYGKEAPMFTTRGKIHNYVGMTLDYNNDGKVQITMFKYIAKIVEEFPMVVCRKYDDTRQTMHHRMACERLENITC